MSSLPSVTHPVERRLRSILCTGNVGLWLQKDTLHRYWDKLRTTSASPIITVVLMPIEIAPRPKFNTE